MKTSKHKTDQEEHKVKFTESELDDNKKKKVKKRFYASTLVVFVFTCWDGFESAASSSAGLVVASVAVEETSTDGSATASGGFGLDDQPLGSNGNVSATATPSTYTIITGTTTNITSTFITTTSSISTAASTVNIAKTDSTMIPSTTKQTGED